MGLHSAVMRIAVQVSLADGTVVDRWPDSVHVSEQDAVAYLALHFRRLSRPVLEAALAEGTLEADVLEGNSRFRVQTTITPG